MPSGGGIIRDLTEVFSKSPLCPGEGKGSVFLVHHA